MGKEILKNPLAIWTSIVAIGAAAAYAGYESEYDLEGRFSDNFHAQPVKGGLFFTLPKGAYRKHGTDNGNIEVHSWCEDKGTLVKAVAKVRSDDSVQEIDREYYPDRHPACEDGEINEEDIGRFNPHRYEYDEYQTPGTFYEGSYYQSEKGPVSPKDIKRGNYVVRVFCEGYEGYFELKEPEWEKEVTRKDSLRSSCDNHQITEEDKQDVLGLVEHH